MKGDPSDKGAARGWAWQVKDDGEWSFLGGSFLFCVYDKRRDAEANRPYMKRNAFRLVRIRFMVEAKTSKRASQ